MSDVQDNTAAQDAATEQAVDQNTQEAPATETPAVETAVADAAQDAEQSSADEVHPAVGELNTLRAHIKAELTAILTGIRTRAHNGEAHLVSLIERL
jgi:hypothetical protein